MVDGRRPQANDRPPEPLLEQLRKGEKAIERLRARGKPDEKIDVTARTRLASNYGAERGKTLNAKRSDVTLGIQEAAKGLLLGQ